MVDDKATVVSTAVGRRWIALMTILNTGDFKRLRQYISDNFAPVLLGEMSVGERIRWHKELFQQTGKLKLYQVLMSDDHHVILVARAQHDNNLYLNEVRVMAEYPHKIIDYLLHPFELEQGQDDE